MELDRQILTEWAVEAYLSSDASRYKSKYVAKVLVCSSEAWTWSLKDLVVHPISQCFHIPYPTGTRNLGIDTT